VLVSSDITSSTTANLLPLSSSRL